MKFSVMLTGVFATMVLAVAMPAELEARGPCIQCSDGPCCIVNNGCRPSCSGGCTEVCSRDIFLAGKVRSPEPVPAPKPMPDVESWDVLEKRGPCLNCGPSDPCCIVNNGCRPSCSGGCHEVCKRDTLLANDMM